MLIPLCLCPRPPPAQRDSAPASNLLFYLGGAAALVLLVGLVLGMLAAKRKSKHGVLWLPEGFMAKKDDKRREPVGQDDFGMKYVKSNPINFIYRALFLQHAAQSASQSEIKTALKNRNRQQYIF